MSEFIAVRMIDEAIEETTEFFSNVKEKLSIRWLKLTIMMIIIGFTANLTFNFEFPNFAEIQQAEIITMLQQNLNLIVVGVIVFILLAIIFGIIRNVFRFVTIKSLKTKEPKFSYFWQYKEMGISLFAFEFILMVFGIILTTIVSLSLIGLFFPDLIAGFNFLDIFRSSSSAFIGAASGLLILVLIVIGFILQLAMYLMYLKNIDAFSAFVQMYKLIAANLKQIVVYIIIAFILNMVISAMIFVISLVTIFILGIVGIILAIPAGVLICINPITLIIIIPIAIILIVLGLILLTAIITPFSSFIINYNLLFVEGLEKETKIF